MNCPLSVPVSRPVLTFSVPGAQALTGDVVELRCEDKRASPPILYRFYHENVPLGNTAAPFGGGASFNLSVTARHSGAYACEADNGLGAQRSDVAVLYVTGRKSPKPPSRTLVAVIPNSGLCVFPWVFLSLEESEFDKRSCQLSLSLLLAGLNIIITGLPVSLSPSDRCEIDTSLGSNQPWEWGK